MFRFEGAEYSLQPNATAEMDQALARIRDGEDEVSAIETLNLPGETLRDKKIQFQILKLAYDQDVK